ARANNARAARGLADRRDRDLKQREAQRLVRCVAEAPRAQRGALAGAGYHEREMTDGRGLRRARVTDHDCELLLRRVQREVDEISRVALRVERELDLAGFAHGLSRLLLGPEHPARALLHDARVIDRERTLLVFEMRGG